MESGELRPGDPTETSVHIGAHVNDVVGIYISGRFPREAVFREFYASSTRLLMSGLRE